MALNTPDPIDRHVGQRLKLARRAEGLTQRALARPLGISFQQLQKHEKGFTRLGAGRLYRLACMLDVPVQFFFDGLSCSKIGISSKASGDTGWRESEPSLVKDRHADTRLSDLQGIGDSGVKDAVHALIRSLRRSLATRGQFRKPFRRE